MKNYNLIIDGGDLSGKTTLISSLLKLYGIKAQDRDKKNICSVMFEHISDDDRIDFLKVKLSTCLKDKKVIFLVNTDEIEIERRKKIREKKGVLDEYDKKALIYNEMYKRAGEALIAFSNFKLIVANDKTKEILIKEIFEWLK